MARYQHVKTSTAAHTLSCRFCRAEERCKFAKLLDVPVSPVL